MKQLLRNTYVDNKRVLLRCDLNVPIQNGNIIDEVEIIVKENIEKAGFFDYLKQSFKFITSGLS